MREYSDNNIRRYAWILQRAVIVAAVIIAVPVTMWTISTFIRTYVARPKIPAFQHLTVTDPTQSLPPPSQLAASIPPEPHAAPTPPLNDAVTTADDGRAPLPDANALKGPLLEPLAEDASPASGPPLSGIILSPQPIPTVTGSSISSSETGPAGAPPHAAALPAPAATTDVIPRVATNGPGTTAAAPTNRGFAWPGPNSDGPSFGAPPEPPTIAETAAAETLPTPEPIKGRVPLPRHRPSVRFMAATANMPTTERIAPTGPLPLPRVRPTDMPVDTSPATNAPSGYEPSPTGH